MDHFNGLNAEQIEFSDFLVRAIDERVLQTSDRLATAFRYFDTDGSGAISPEEIVEGLNFCDEDRMDEHVAEAIMNQIQPDLEELSLKNFILLIKHYRSGAPASAPAPVQN